MNGPFAKATTKLANGQPVVIQVIGDSTAWGYGDSGEILAGDPWTPPTLRGWPGRFATLLGQKYNATVQVYTWNYPDNTGYTALTTLYSGTGPATITVYDGGWPGGTMANILATMAAMLPISNPDILIGYDGYNDLNGSATTFADNYVTFVSQVQNTYCPNTPIVVTTQNGTPNAYDPSGYNTMIDQFLPGASTGFMSPPLQQSTNTPNLWVLDTQQCPLLGTDIYAGVHPDASGYTKVAQFIYNELLPNLGVLPWTLPFAVGLGTSGLPWKLPLELGYTSQTYLRGHGTLAASAQAVQFSVPAPLTGRGVLSATAANIAVLPWTLPVKLPSASKISLQGKGVLSGSAAERQFVAAHCTGNGVLSGTAQVPGEVTPRLSGAGLLSAKTGQSRAAQLRGAGRAAASGVAVFGTTAVFAGTGTLTARSNAIKDQALHGRGALTASAAAVAFFISAELPGSGRLTAPAAGIARTASPTGSGVLTATAFIATIRLNVTLQGAAAISAAVNPALLMAFGRLSVMVTEPPPPRRTLIASGASRTLTA